MRAFRTTALLVGIILPMQLFAQSDFGVWSGLDFRYKASKKLRVGLQVEGRFDSNASEVDQTFLSPYIKYDLHKMIRVGADYRLANRPESGFFGEKYTHRMTLDAEFRNLLGSIEALERFSVDTRLRFTHTTRQNGELNNDYLRGRIKIGYNLPKTKLTPHIAAECFYHFNDQLVFTPTEVRANHRFNKYRIRIGASYSIKKQHKLSAFYMIQPEIEGPDTDYILSLGYQFSFGK